MFLFRLFYTEINRSWNIGVYDTHATMDVYETISCKLSKFNILSAGIELECAKKTLYYNKMGHSILTESDATVISFIIELFVKFIGVIELSINFVYWIVSYILFPVFGLLAVMVFMSLCVIGLAFIIFPDKTHSRMLLLRKHPIAVSIEKFIKKLNKKEKHIAFVIARTSGNDASIFDETTLFGEDFTISKSCWNSDSVTNRSCVRELQKDFVVPSENLFLISQLFEPCESTDVNKENILVIVTDYCFPTKESGQPLIENIETVKFIESHILSSLKHVSTVIFIPLKNYVSEHDNVVRYSKQLCIIQPESDNQKGRALLSTHFTHHLRRVCN